MSCMWTSCNIKQKQRFPIGKYTFHNVTRERAQEELPWLRVYSRESNRSGIASCSVYGSGACETPNSTVLDREFSAGDPSDR